MKPTRKNGDLWKWNKMESASGPTEASNARDYAESSYKLLYRDLEFLANHLGVVLPSQQDKIDARKKLRDDFLVIAEKLGISAPDNALDMWNALINSPESVTKNWTKEQRDLVTVVWHNTKGGKYNYEYWGEEHCQLSLRNLLCDTRWTR